VRGSLVEAHLQLVHGLGLLSCVTSLSPHERISIPEQTDEGVPCLLQEGLPGPRKKRNFVFRIKAGSWVGPLLRLAMRLPPFPPVLLLGLHIYQVATEIGIVIIVMLVKGASLQEEVREIAAATFN